MLIRLYPPRRLWGAAFAALTMISANLCGDDWPQWLGPTRDGVYHETGTVTNIPVKGLPVLWRTPISGGYAGPSVAKGRVFVPDFLRTSGDAVNDPGKRAELKGTERLWCLDSMSGKVLWKDEYPCDYSISYPAGPRCTPTVDGDLVYSLGAQGDLRCLEVATGKLRWQKNLAQAYQATVPIWGHSAHPLIDGPRLICMVGGKDQAVVALDKLTGNEVWRSLSSSDAGYCPPSKLEVGGRASLLVWHPEEMASLEPATGKPIWTVDLKPDYQMSITQPQREGDLLYASGIGSTSVLLQLAADGSDVKELWRGEQKTSLYAANATPLIVDGVIYGSDCQTGAFMAVDTKDGSRLWQTYQPIQDGNRRISHGTAFVTRQADRFWLFSETGHLILANLTPKAYQELGRMKVLEPTEEAFGRPVVWSSPAFANHCVFCRNDKEIVCVSLKP